MDIVEHLVMDDLVVVGDKLCVSEHLVVSNEIAGIESLAYLFEELHIATDVDLVLDIHVVIIDVGLDTLVVDMDGCDKFHVDWLVVIQMLLMFGWLKQI